MNNAMNDEHNLFVKMYSAKCWYDEVGSLKNYSIYQKRGLPNIRGWKFITLTIDPSKYYDEEHCFEVGNRHFRQFLYLLRLEYGDFEFMKKIEFHKSGYVHWHLIVSIRQKVDIPFVRKIWGKGRIDVEKVRRKYAQGAIDYLFKYACKAQDLPEWVLKRKTFRFVSFSKNFFTGEKPSPTPSKRPSQGKAKPPKKTIGEIIENWKRSVIIGYKQKGKFLYNRVQFKEGCTWKDFLHTAINLKIYYNNKGIGSDFGAFYKEIFMNDIRHFFVFLDENLLDVPEVLVKPLSRCISMSEELPPMGQPF